MFTRAQSGRVTQRCRNSPDWKRRLASANDVTHRKRAEDFGRFWKSQLVEMRPASGEDGWLSLARGDLYGGCHTCLRGKWKSQNRKTVPLSSYVEEPLNSKVIKSFVPEQRNRQVFFGFRDSYVLCYILMDIRCTFHTLSYHGSGTKLRNWIVWNRIIWSFNFVLTNDWCLIELLVIHSNIWNYLIACQPNRLGL